MPYQVLVVDDSQFFQQRLKEIINEHPELNVCGIAADGNEAIKMAVDLKPDIISMDYEMPYLDGVSAVRIIMSERPVPIVMFSSMTYEGARITLDALDAGAVDFIPKNFAEVSRDSAQLKRKLHETLLMFVRKSSPRPMSHVRKDPPAASQTLSSAAKTSDTRETATRFAPPQPEVATDPIERRQRKDIPSRPQKSIRGTIKLVVIGASTGGPVALTEVLQKLPMNYGMPVVVIQHMPENFTKALADRLDKQCQVRVVEATMGDKLKPGHVYIAPGGHQLIFDGRSGIKILPGDARMNYKPSVDITFASAANIYGSAVLGVVLTGMGADGCEGARLLKLKGATIWAQDQQSCVVYGMPKAVAQAKLTDDVMPLRDIGTRIARDT